MSNSDTSPFEMSQFGQWYMLAGIEQYIDDIEDECQIDTIELELNRIQEWDREHGGYFDCQYTQNKYAELWTKLAELREWIQQRDRLWYADCAREDFYVIDGGKK